MAAGVALAEVASLERDSVRPQDADPETPYLGLEHIESGGVLDWSQSIGSAGVTSGKYRFSDHHVLFGKLRPYLCKVARPDRAGVCSTDIIPVLPGPDIDRGYLFHFLQHPATVELATLRSSGANLPRLSPKKLAEFEVPLPPLPEQKRIATILDAADGVRAKRRESIQQLDALAQSVFLDMFGDPVKNPKGWPKSRLDDLMRVRRGGSPRPIKKYLGGTVNWVKISDATRSADDLYIQECAERISEDGLNKTTLLEPGSFVFANSGVSLGFARILKVRGAIHDGWLAFDQYCTDQLNSLFFLKALNSITEHFRRIAPAGTQPNLNTGIMKDFELILPPIQRQRKFAAIIESAEAQKTLLRSRLTELDTLFSSLQSRAFRGEL